MDKNSGRSNESLISIIVPIYNVEQYLKRCVDSLLKQSYKNIEIILIDDGSPDNCPSICDEYAKDDSRIRVFHKTNGGLSDARNYGLKQSLGEFIIFVDADDYVDKNYISTLFENIIKYKADISICSYYYSYNEQNTLGTLKNSSVQVFNNIEAIKELYKFNSYGVGVWNKLFKRELLWTDMFPVGKISEDYFVMYRVFFAAHTVVYESEPLYYYVQRGDSITKKGKPKVDVIDAAEGFLDFCVKNCNELVPVAKTNLVYAAVGIYNTGMFRNNMDNMTKRRLVEIVNDNISGMDKSYLHFDRKLQIILFTYFRPVYNILFVNFKRIRIKIKGR